MYTERQRDELCEKITEFMLAEPEFEGLLHIGSGAAGYADIYSDIDLMAGCTDGKVVNIANEKLLMCLESLGAVYIDRRRWSDSVLGLSAYFENGLSVDISFMPVEALRVRSGCWKCLFSKSVRFTDQIEKSAENLQVDPKNFGIDDSIYHKFVYAMRRCEIATLRGEYIYADMALSEARQYLLYVEAAREGKKLHQFKRYQSLDRDFLEELVQTYPVPWDRKSIVQCAENLIKMYMDTVEKCDFLQFDLVQLKLLNCFSESGEK